MPPEPSRPQSRPSDQEIVELAKQRLDRDGILQGDALYQLADELGMDVNDLDAVLAEAGWADVSEVGI